MLSIYRTISTLALFAAAVALPLTLADAQSTGSICNDGSSSSAVGSGACSGHGGVNVKATKRISKLDRQAGKGHSRRAAHAAAQIVCADGAVVSSGDCGHNGGILHGNPNHPVLHPDNQPGNHPDDHAQHHPADASHVQHPHADTLHGHHGDH